LRGGFYDDSFDLLTPETLLFIRQKRYNY